MAQKDPKANWQPAVVKTEISPRSYLITDNNDRVLRRNLSHLLRMKVPELTSTNSERRPTRTSDNTDPNSSQHEAQSQRQTIYQAGDVKQLVRASRTCHFAVWTNNKT